MKKTICSNMMLLVVGTVVCLLSVEQVARADFEFGTPTSLGPSVNDPAASNFDCCISADGLTLIFASNRPPAGPPAADWYFDLWMTTRATKHDTWSPAERLADVINSAPTQLSPWLSPDGLELYYAQGPVGNTDICVSRRNSPSEPWGAPENLGPMVNSSTWDTGPSLTADGLELYFNSDRSGPQNLYVSTRATRSDPWGQAVNLGPNVNSTYSSMLFGDQGPSISPDGLTLVFSSIRPSTGTTAVPTHLWMTRRSTRQSEWGAPVLLALPEYSTNEDFNPSFGDGVLYFGTTRGGWWWGIWQVEVNPILDFNGDGVVDILDAYALLGHWGEHNSLYDIAPSPFGDGVVDTKDLIVLAEHLGVKPSKTIESLRMPMCEPTPMPGTFNP